MFCFAWFGVAWKRIKQTKKPQLCNFEFFLLSSVPNCFDHKKKIKGQNCLQYWGSEGGGGTNPGKDHYKRHSELFSCCDMARGGRGKFLGWLELETSCLSFCRENHQLFHANCHLGRFHPLQEKTSPANAPGIISIY